MTDVWRSDIHTYKQSQLYGIIKNYNVYIRRRQLQGWKSAEAGIYGMRNTELLPNVVALSYSRITSNAFVAETK